MAALTRPAAGGLSHNHHTTDTKIRPPGACIRIGELSRELGEAGPAVLGGPLPDKPLRMRWPTYERLCGEVIEAEERALSSSARLLARVTAAGT